MNVLNSVKIENTFRISAISALEAAEMAAPTHRDNVVVKPVLGEFDTFITRSEGSCNIVVHTIIFVEMVSTGKYRVEVSDSIIGGHKEISETDYLYLIGGDDAVNEVSFYQGDRDVISQDDLNVKLAEWAECDAEKGTPGRMVDHIKNEYKKVVMINGKFEEVK